MSFFYNRNKNEQPEKKEENHQSEEIKIEEKKDCEIVPKRPECDVKDFDNVSLITEYLYGKQDLTADLKKIVERKTERQRMAFNFISSNTVASMAELQDYIQRCQTMLFRPERLQVMNDDEIAKSMLVAISLFEKESAFALKVADMNKDFSPAPDKQTKLADAISNLPKDVLEAMIKQIKGK
jgi:hypothetical protein